jgi:polar amino acid transport system permease protein
MHPRYFAPESFPFIGGIAGHALAGKFQQQLVQESTVEQVIKRGTLRVGVSTFVPWAMKDKTAKPKITIIDLVLGALIIAFGFYIVHKVSVGLSYKWNWGAIPQYFFRYDSATSSWVPNILVEGFLTTIRLSIWATVFATFIGIVMGLSRVSQSLFKRLVGGTYVELIRNLPPLVLIFIFYFFVSTQILTTLGVEEFIRTRDEKTLALMTFLFAKPSLFTA